MFSFLVLSVFYFLIFSILFLEICIPVQTHREVIFSFTLVVPLFFLRIYSVLRPRKFIMVQFSSGVNNELGELSAHTLAGLVGACLDAVASNSLGMRVVHQVLGLALERVLHSPSWAVRASHYWA